VADRSVDAAPGRTPTVENSGITVTIRYFAAARAAAGVQEERIRVPTIAAGQGISGDTCSLHDIPASHSTVGQILDGAADRHGPGLARVLARCSFLLDEVAVHGRQTPVLDGQVLDILPPFAGG
jgi:molybdopterin converting factor small subunit